MKYPIPKHQDPNHTQFPNSNNENIVWLLAPTPLAKGGQRGMMYLIFVLQIEHIGLEFNIKVIPFFSSPCPLYLREAVTVGGGYKERGIS
jgi:hypothetical protein